MPGDGDDNVLAEVEASLAGAGASSGGVT
jgi:hypothetical protein